MLNIDNYENILRKQPKLQKDIHDLISFIVRENKFRFKKSDFPFDIELFINSGILRDKNSNIEVADSALFFETFIAHFSLKFSFQLTADVQNSFQFIKSIEEELKTNTFRSGVFAFFESCKSFILFKMHKSLNTDFDFYIKNLTKESGDELYDFNNAYCKILPYLSTDPKVLFDCLKHLILAVAVEKGIINGNLGEINDAVRLYSKLNPKSAQQLLRYSLKNPGDAFNEINTPVIAGIYETKREKFWKQVLRFWNKEANRLFIISSLSSVPAIIDEEAKKQYDMVSAISLFSLDETYNLPRFYTSIISNKNINYSLLKKECFDRLEEIIVNPNLNIQLQTLWQIKFLEGYDPERILLINKLLNLPEFDKVYLGNVGDALVKHRHLDSFIDLLKYIAERFNLFFTAEHFSSVIHYFHEKEPEKFSTELIHLSTDNKGNRRFIGNEIIDFLGKQNRPFKFKVDILKFPALVQYKIWVSIILCDVKQPKENLPMLLPLLGSEYGFVKEAFICKLEQLTEDYGVSVLEVMEKELDMNITFNADAFERVKSYKERKYNEIDKKYQIKEWNPAWTHSKLYRLYIENHDKLFTKDITKSIDKQDIFTQIAQTVILAKSGGWKMPDRDGISQLGTVGVQFQLPKSMFIFPERGDYEYHTFYLKNWEIEFKKWEVIISS